jgi:hypothetical protein
VAPVLGEEPGKIDRQNDGAVLDFRDPKVAGQRQLVEAGAPKGHIVFQLHNRVGRSVQGRENRGYVAFKLVRRVIGTALNILVRVHLHTPLECAISCRRRRRIKRRRETRRARLAHISPLC